MTYWREMYKIDILVDCKLLDGTKIWPWLLPMSMATSMRQIIIF